MSDDPSTQQVRNEKTNGQPNNGQQANGQTGDDSQGTVLGDNAGVYIPSKDDDSAEEMEVSADFGSFIVSLGTNCMINLGRIEHPETGDLQIDLESARHTIEIIDMLQDKTEGNLDSEEQKLVESLLHDLRSAFVKEKNKAKN